MVVYAFYIAKVALYVLGWALFVTASSDGELADIGRWWSEPIAFQKAIVWTLLWEGLGLGCASGPLTGRYVPPVGGALYFLRPGTTRLRAFTWVPGTAGVRRTWLDVALYIGVLATGVNALLSPEVGPAEVAPVIATLVILGLRDRTVFLATRFEHHLTTLVVFLFAGDVLAGSRWVLLAIWFWAATSKLNRHFPAVIAVMVSNHPILRWKGIRRAMYRAFPDDLRPSRTAGFLAHAGTVVEYSFPLLLVFGRGGTLAWVGIAVMIMFHTTIVSSAPMGVPLEWNVVVVYSAIVLFGVHGAAPIGPTSPVLIVFLLTLLVAVPVLGNLVPSRVSFLPSMRYYAGNWATSTWLLTPSAMAKIEAGLVKSARDVATQLERFYDETTCLAIEGKALAFRSMHLHGRAYHDLLPAAAGSVADLERYTIRDGELIAGLVLGWNFGDGHLHDERLVAALHEQCGFTTGEVRAVMLESEPFLGGLRGNGTMHWRIVDGCDGTLDQGHIRTRDLQHLQPWAAPTAT